MLVSVLTGLIIWHESINRPLSLDQGTIHSVTVSGGPLGLEIRANRPSPPIPMPFQLDYKVIRGIGATPANPYSDGLKPR